MKNFWKISVFVFVIALSGSASAETNKIGIINLKKVFDNYWKTKRSRAVIDQQRAEADKQDKELIESWKKSREEYQKLLDSANDQTVSADERDRRKKAAEAELRKMKATEQDIQLFERTTASKLDDAMRRMIENLFDEIRNAVNAKAKVAGYSLVIDTSAETVRGTPVIVYNNGENDLTDIILSQLNAGAPPEEVSKPAVSKPDEKKGK